MGDQWDWLLMTLQNKAPYFIITIGQPPNDEGLRIHFHGYPDFFMWTHPNMYEKMFSILQWGKYKCYLSMRIEWMKSDGFIFIENQDV